MRKRNFTLKVRTFSHILPLLAAALLAQNTLATAICERPLITDSQSLEGWTAGRVRVLTPSEFKEAALADEIQPDDLLVLESVPSHLPRVAGLVLTSQATISRHLVTFGQRYRAPIFSAPELKSVLKALDGKFTYIVKGLGHGEVFIRELSSEDLQRLLILREDIPSDLSPENAAPPAVYDINRIPRQNSGLGSSIKGLAFLRKTIPENVSAFALALPDSFYDAAEGDNLTDSLKPLLTDLQKLAGEEGRPLRLMNGASTGASVVLTHIDRKSVATALRQVWSSAFKGDASVLIQREFQNPVLNGTLSVYQRDGVIEIAAQTATGQVHSLVAGPTVVLKDHLGSNSLGPSEFKEISTLAARVFRAWPDRNEDLILNLEWTIALDHQQNRKVFFTSVESGSPVNPGSDRAFFLPGPHQISIAPLNSSIAPKGLLLSVSPLPLKDFMKLSAKTLNLAFVHDGEIVKARILSIGRKLENGTLTLLMRTLHPSLGAVTITSRLQIPKDPLIDLSQGHYRIQIGSESFISP